MGVVSKDFSGVRVGRGFIFDAAEGMYNILNYRI